MPQSADSLFCVVAVSMVWRPPLDTWLITFVYVDGVPNCTGDVVQLFFHAVPFVMGVGSDLLFRERVWDFVAVTSTHRSLL